VFFVKESTEHDKKYEVSFRTQVRNLKPLKFKISTFRRNEKITPDIVCIEFLSCTKKESSFIAATVVVLRLSGYLRKKNGQISARFLSMR